MPRRKSNKPRKVRMGQYCPEDEKNFCIAKKKYRDDYMLVSDFDIFPNQRIKVVDCLNNIDSVIKNISLEKVDNYKLETTTNSEEENKKIIRDINEIVDEKIEEDSQFNLFLEFYPDTYKYVIDLQDGYTMDYYRLLRVAGHAAKDLIEQLQKEHENNIKKEEAKKARKEEEGDEYEIRLKYDFEPMDRLDSLYISNFGIGIYKESSDENNSSKKDTPKKTKDIQIYYKGFNPNIDDSDPTAAL